MEAKHTPGPWSVEDPMDFELTIVEANKPTHEWKFIASCSLPDGDDDQAFTSAEIRANAYLISSAPELLEAVQNLMGLFDNAIYRQRLSGDGLYADAVVQARAAIAKATQQKGDA